MPPTRKTRPEHTSLPDSFEERTTATLDAQDRILERMEQKLESPVLNGGFDDLVKRVEKIDGVTEKLRDCQADTSKQVSEIHSIVLDPEAGLYHKVKANSHWIDNANKATKWIACLLIAGTLTGIGKLLYDFITGHIHFTP
jgi:hypothetical protein